MESGIDKGIQSIQKNHGISGSGEVMGSDQRNGKGSSLMNLLNEEDSSRQSPNMKMLEVPSSVKLDHGCITDKHERNDRKGCCDKTCDESGKSSNSCSKINENSSSVGPLRYALHLRFICPFPKKTNRSVQKCRYNSLPEKDGLDMDGERKFYLCNDLRVVFPQRHTDADEGKVCAYM